MATSQWSRRPRARSHLSPEQQLQNQQLHFKSPLDKINDRNSNSEFDDDDDDDDDDLLLLMDNRSDLSDSDSYTTSLSRRRRMKEQAAQDERKKKKKDPTRAPKLGALLFLCLISFVFVSKLMQSSQEKYEKTVIVDEESDGDGEVSLIRGRKNNKEDNEDEEEEEEDEDEDEDNKKPKRNRKEPTDDDERRIDGNNSTNDNDDYNTNNKKEIVYFTLPEVKSLPNELVDYAEVTDPPNPMLQEIPFFFHVPRAGGTTIKEIASTCLGLTLASEVGTVDGHDQDTSLQVLQDVDGAKFVNVDTTWLGGIQRAVDLDLASSGLVDLIVSPYIYASGDLFSDSNKGRLFAMLRHPIHRAVSMYHFLRTEKEGAKLLDGASLEKYARSDFVENNWVTRFLSNQMAGELTPKHEAIAREVLRRKTLIGLLEEKGESMERFERYFGWRSADEKGVACHERLLDWDWSHKNKHPLVKEGDKVWNILESENTFDMRLYEYAKVLFREQGNLLWLQQKQQ